MPFHLTWEEGVKASGGCIQGADVSQVFMGFSENLSLRIKDLAAVWMPAPKKESAEDVRAPLTLAWVECGESCCLLLFSLSKESWLPGILQSDGCVQDRTSVPGGEADRCSFLPQQSDEECVLDLELITDLILQIDAQGEPGRRWDLSLQPSSSSLPPSLQVALRPWAFSERERLRERD